MRGDAAADDGVARGLPKLPALGDALDAVVVSLKSTPQ
jgi:hypothetical protein